MAISCFIAKQQPSALGSHRNTEIHKSLKLCHILKLNIQVEGFPSGSVESTCGAEAMRDVGLILALGRSPERGNGNPLQSSCLENPTDRGPWQVTVHSVAKSRI